MSDQQCNERRPDRRILDDAGLGPSRGLRHRAKRPHCRDDFFPWVHSPGSGLDRTHADPLLNGHQNPLAHLMRGERDIRPRDGARAVVGCALLFYAVFFKQNPAKIPAVSPRKTVVPRLAFA